MSGGTVTWDRLLVTDGLSPEAVEQITAVSPAAPDRVWVVIDHDTPAGSVAVAEKQKALLDWARQTGAVFRSGRGIGYALLLESGLREGEIVLSGGAHAAADYHYEDDRNSADIQVPEVTVAPDTDADTQKSSAVSEQTKKTAEEINTEIQTITDRLIAEFEESKKNEEGYQNMTVKSEILATTDQYFTLKLICFQSAGSGAEWNYYYTIDLSTGKRLQLADLFQESSDYLTTISDNIKQQMKEQMAADENKIYWLDSDMPEWDFTSITDNTSFYLNQNNEVVVCFNEGDVAPMSMGCPEFVIPNEVLAGIRK